jgi:hypothetical protein
MDEIINAAHLLAHIIDQHRSHLAEIRRLGEASARSWLNGIASGLGGALGAALGKVIGSLFRGFGG